MEDLKLKGNYENYDYETGEPYLEEESISLENEGKVVLVCQDDSCIYILPEWVDDIVKFLSEWK